MNNAWYGPSPKTRNTVLSTLTPHGAITWSMGMVRQSPIILPWLPKKFAHSPLPRLPLLIVPFSFGVQLKAALRVIESWGFSYKTLAFLWLKQNRKSDTWFYGMGFWTRSNAEVCLLATRGHPKRQSAGIHQLIISRIEEHSKKPAVVRSKIVQLLSDLPRIELFARQKTPGWDVWGNEVKSDISLVPHIDGCVEPVRR